MKVTEWKTYRTRFLIQAKQLDSSLSFTDHLGRQHCGRKGDYLVESYDGVISIAPRRIFEDIYVPMAGAQDNGRARETGGAQEPALTLSKGFAGFARPGKFRDSDSAQAPEAAFDTREVRPLDLPSVPIERLLIERIKPAGFPYPSRDSTRSRGEIARTRRKSPMSVPSTATRVRLM